jgi:hypothetical protein
MNIDLIIKTWEKFGVDLNSNASQKEISDLETEINFQFPVNFKNLYLRVNGFDGIDLSFNLFSFCSLSRIKEEYNNKDFIPICDFLISSHFLGYFKGQNGIYQEGNQFLKVCDNIEELVKLIEQDSELIY